MSNYSLNKIQGVTMIEYALIAGLISIAAIVAILAMGPKLLALFQTVNTNL